VSHQHPSHGLEKMPPTKILRPMSNLKVIGTSHHRLDGHIKNFFGVNHSGADTLRDIARSVNV
jgi:hypothetical protein